MSSTKLGPSIQKAQRILVAFDFDHTIVDDNTDVVARKLLKGKLPAEVEALPKAGEWTLYMENIFKTLHREGVNKVDLLSAVTSIPATKDMLKLLDFLRSPECEVIIISDSNSVFIEEWLACHDLSNAVSKTYTNSAHFDSTGCLNIEKYHVQDWCDLSEKNLCKGHILEQHVKDQLKEGIVFSTIAYVGDGKNDLCPSLRLSNSDLLFVRAGYSLHKTIERNKKQLENKHNIKAAVHIWSDASEIQTVFSSIL